jgi:hypothetical protein
MVEVCQQTSLIDVVIDVDGRMDRHGIRYLGKAILMGDGTWRCLADVAGTLCVVEITITKFEELPKKNGMR